MTISVSNQEFENAQAKLAEFLESKYAIKNQSKGLLEYGAAFILGYKNHHQLNDILQKGNSSFYRDLSEQKCEVKIYMIVTNADITEDVILDGKVSEGFDAGDVTQHLLNHFNLKPLQYSQNLLSKLVDFFNQDICWSYHIYNNSDDFKNRRESYFSDEYTYKSQAIAMLKSMHREGHFDNKEVVIKLQDHNREHIYVLKGKVEISNYLKSVK
jgi:hypothetical protein